MARVVNVRYERKADAKKSGIGPYMIGEYQVNLCDLMLPST